MNELLHSYLPIVIFVGVALGVCVALIAALASGAFRGMAGATGLEPATSGVTGRHSNQLNYRSA